MKKYYLLWITHHGDDWESGHKELFENKEKMEEFKKEHEEEMNSVNGVEYVSFHSQLKTDEELRYFLTVEEYCKLHPELKSYIEENYNQ